MQLGTQLLLDLFRKANKDNSVTILAALIPVIFADFFINSFLDISFFYIFCRP